MFVRFRRGLAASALMVGLAVGSAHALEFLDCADYISTAITDEPAMGELMGTSEVTYNIGVNPGGIGASYTESFQVGNYRMTDGTVLRIDCRDYTVFG
jgi:hypothetical protein